MHTIRERVAWWLVGVVIMMMPAGAMAQELTELSAAEAAARIRAGTLKSEDLVRALVDVIERKRDLNAQSLLRGQLNGPSFAERPIITTSATLKGKFQST